MVEPTLEQTGVDPDIVSTVGSALTVRVAAEEALELQVLLKTAWNWSLVCDKLAVKLYGLAVAPGMFVNEPPPCLACHCTLGEGEPLAAAEKLAVLPAQTVKLAGLVVTEGAVLTVRVAAEEVLEPHVLLKTAWNSSLLCDALVVKLYGLAVAPGMLVNEPPPWLACHCMLTEPLAAAEKVAVFPAHAVKLVGLVVTEAVALTVNVRVVDSVTPSVISSAFTVMLLVTAGAEADAVKVKVVVRVASLVEIPDEGEKLAVTPLGRMVVL